MSQLINEYLLDAVAIVSAWDDVPDEEFADTVNAQARLMAGCSPDDVSQSADDGSFPTH
jgi:hypothetical protein